MRRAGVLVCLLLAAGCAKEATPQLIEKLKSPDAPTRLKAARTLPERTAEPTLVVPALIDALQDEDADVRRSAAAGLGTFGEQAREAVPSLQACLRDREYRVRKAAGQSLKRIDPAAATKAGVR
jgi:HEAT repeat protein